MKKENLENYLRTHLDDVFNFTIKITSVNKETEEIKSAGFKGKVLLDMLMFELSPFEEILERMLIVESVKTE